MSDEIRFGISELADAAGVSVRTVRYYITEGLLPPPVTAGAKSYYTPEHRDRLIVIGRLKDGYLPLREIRRQLAEMDDAAIHELAHAEEMTGEDIHQDRRHLDFPLVSDQSLRIAEDLLGTYEHEEIRLPKPERAARQRDSASDYIGRVLKQAPAQSQVPRPAPAAAARPIPPAQHETAAEQSSWRRIAIGDGAELLIREDLYHRRHDKVTWLVDWAKKVLS